VPGNFQPEIATPLFREWRVLDELCAGYPAGLVVNVIDRGARLRNTTVILPDECVVEGGVETKRAALAGLGEAREPANDLTPQMLERIGGAMERIQPLIAQARAAVAGNEVHRATQALMSAYRDKDFSMLMGNYCLKVLPHLVRPDSANTPLWRSLIAETEQLIAVARALV